VSEEAAPIERLRRWLDEAGAAETVEPSAMVVATATRDGRPAARVVLLRGLDEAGLVFFSNYESRKGSELAANPFAAAVFYWRALERQVRVEGRVERIAAEASDEYFESRPRGHRLSAWASAQSRVVPSRAYLEEEMAAVQERFAGVEIPRPPYWGGYRIVPERFEFWHARPDRMHDRIVYERGADGWSVVRLSP
jgi:pyridoxamine 5'-phosphate oxidase